MNFLYDSFLIRPIRNIAATEQHTLVALVATLRDSGQKIYDPLTDTKQLVSSLDVLRQNREGMKQSSEVLLWYSPTSDGSIFDLGMVYGFGKHLEIINADLIIDASEFVQEILDTIRGTHICEKLEMQKKHIGTATEIPLVWKPTLDRIFYFGMAFAREKKIIVNNLETVHRTSEKSFENALLELSS